MSNGKETKTQAGSAGAAGTAGSSEGQGQTEKETDTSSAGSSGEVRGSSTRPRKEPDNEPTTPTARQVIDEATKAEGDTGEIIKAISDYKAARLAKLLGHRKQHRLSLH